MKSLNVEAACKYILTSNNQAIHRITINGKHGEEDKGKGASE